MCIIDNPFIFLSGPKIIFLLWLCGLRNIIYSISSDNLTCQPTNVFTIFLLNYVWPLLSLVSSLSLPPPHRQSWLCQIAAKPWGVPLYPGEKEQASPSMLWLPSLLSLFSPIFLLHTLYHRLPRPVVWFRNVPFFLCKVLQPDQCPPIKLLWRGLMPWHPVLIHAQPSLACSEFVIFIFIVNYDLATEGRALFSVGFTTLLCQLIILPPKQRGLKRRWRNDGLLPTSAYFTN